MHVTTYLRRQPIAGLAEYILSQWGRVTHICVGKQTIIGSDNGLSFGRRQAIIWTNCWILLIGPPGTNFSEISTKILTFSFAKMRLKVSSAKWRPFCLGLNVLIKVTSGVTCDIYLCVHTRPFPQNVVISSDSNDKPNINLDRVNIDKNIYKDVFKIHDLIRPRQYRLYFALWPPVALGSTLTEYCWSSMTTWYKTT